jgi:predicted  nucleic acid-binding Zn-ribbon protein
MTRKKAISGMIPNTHLMSIEDTVERLIAEIKELRDTVDKVQAELDSCKRDFYDLTEKYLGIVRD